MASPCPAWRKHESHHRRLWRRFRQRRPLAYLLPARCRGPHPARRFRRRRDHRLEQGGFATSDVDAIVVTHLHGDHFGGLPFLLLQCQFVERRRKPITLLGPPGLRARLDMALEVFFPGTSAMHWTFDWSVEEIIPGHPHEIAGFSLLTLEVDHPSGAPSTGVRVGAGGRLFAYSGDTAWTETLVDLAAGADLFVVECYSAERPIPGHMDWPTLDANRARLDARRLMLTHMGEDAASANSAARFPTRHRDLP